MPTSSSCCGVACTYERSSRRSAPETRPTPRTVDRISAHTSKRSAGCSSRCGKTMLRSGATVAPFTVIGLHREKKTRTSYDLCCRRMKSIRPDDHGPARRSHSSSSARDRGPARMRSENDGEALFVPCLADGEAAHESAADAVGAFRVLVFPGSRVARARREHVHVVPVADLLGQHTARVVGTGGDVGAVARRDEGELHPESPSARPYPGPRAGPASQEPAPQPERVLQVARSSGPTALAAVRIPQPVQHRVSAAMVAPMASVR